MNIAKHSAYSYRPSRSMQKVITELGRQGYSGFIDIPDRDEKSGLRYLRAQHGTKEVLVKLGPLGDQPIPEEEIASLLMSTDVGFPNIYQRQVIDSWAVTITSYVRGTPIQVRKYTKISDEFRDSLPRFLSEFSLEIRQLNTLKSTQMPVRSDDYFIEKLGTYIEQIGDEDKELHVVLNQVARFFAEHYKLNAHEYAIQHGDLYGANIIFTSAEKFVPIDWELAQVTSRYFDIATFIAKDLLSTEIVNRAYGDALAMCNGGERINLNCQVILAMVKDYRNIYVVGSEAEDDQVLNNYLSLLRSCIASNQGNISNKLVLDGHIK